MIIGAIMTLHSVCSMYATIDKSRSFDITYTKTDDRKKENLEKKERTSKKASNTVI